MLNLLSLLFQLRTIIFIVLVFGFIYFSDDVFRNDLAQKVNLGQDSQVSAAKDKNEKTNLETDKIYLMYKDKFKVIKVIDGDTIYVRKLMPDQSLENYTYKIRLMAIDTLEKDSKNSREKCLANLAQQFTEQNLLDKFVYIYGDSTQPELDQYKRVLAYVLLEGDNEFFNDKVMKSGFAYAYKATPPATNWQKYQNIKEKLKEEKKGIWDQEICKI